MEIILSKLIGVSGLVVHSRALTVYERGVTFSALWYCPVAQQDV